MSNGPIPMAVCYGPYHQQGKPKTAYTMADVEADMAIVSKYFHKIRTYTVQDADQYNVEAASKHRSRSALERGFSKVTGLGHDVRLTRQYSRLWIFLAKSYIS